MSKGPLYVTLCYVFWGLLPIFWKTLNSLNSLYVLASRIFWSLLFCTIILLARKNWGQLKTVFQDKKQLLKIAICAILITINWGSYIWAVNANHIIDASLAYYMEPIIVIFFGAVIFKERLTKLHWGSVALAALGVIVPIIYYGEFPFIALVIAVTFAVYGALKKTINIDGLLSIFMETLIMAPLALGFIIYMETRQLGALAILDGWQYLLLPLSGVVTSIPLILFSHGIKETPYNLSGILMYINPTIELLVGVLLFHEQFTAVQGVTFGFVWIAIIVYLVANRSQLKSPDSASIASISDIKNVSNKATTKSSK